MYDDTKPRHKKSLVAKAVSEAADHNYKKMTEAREGKPGACDFIACHEKEADRLLNEITTPLEDYQIEGIGAGGELMLGVGFEMGDTDSKRLRDTVKDPDRTTVAAQLDRTRLLEETGTTDIALDVTSTIKPRNSLEKMLAHQLATLHVMSMRMASKAEVWMDKSAPTFNPFGGTDERSGLAMVEAARGMTAAAKMMQTFQQGLLTLHRIRSGGKQQVNVIHQHVQVAGGNVAVAGVNKGGGKHGGGSRRK